jgi:hypothetical protein
MKIALLQCPAWGRDCPPYTLAYFNALLQKHGHQVQVFDVNNLMYHASSPELKKYWDDKDYYSYWENRAQLGRLIDAHADLLDGICREIADRGVQAVSFTTHTTSFIVSLDLAARIKKLNGDITVIFGGPQCSRSQIPHQLITYPQVDYVCPGEGDVALPRLLEKLQAGRREPQEGFFFRDGQGRVTDGGDPEIPQDLDALPVPDYEPFRPDIEQGKYREPHRLDIFDSRGCITCCHFCSEWQFWKKYRTVSGERIFAEIVQQQKKFPGVNYFYFNGSLINGDLQVLERWCDLVIKNGLRIRWAGQALPRGDMSGGLIRKMKQSGCVWLGFGIESGSQRVLDAMNKRFSVDEALRVLKDTHEAGISVQINIMFGLPTETADDFEKTLGFLLAARPSIDTILASQSFCVIDKGTILHRHPERFGITGQEHHLFWSSNNGENDFAERFRRYEKFCKAALALGIPETSGVLAVKPDKWFLLGHYYRHAGQHARAAECFERSLRDESENEETRSLARECRSAAEKCRNEAETNQ